MPLQKHEIRKCLYFCCERLTIERVYSLKQLFDIYLDICDIFESEYIRIFSNLGRNIDEMVRMVDTMLFTIIWGILYNVIVKLFQLICDFIS